MKLKDIPHLIDGPVVRLKKEIGKVIYADTKRKRPKYLVRTPNGQQVWWFADKCTEVVA